jgi:molecular chaperone HscB
MPSAFLVEQMQWREALDELPADGRQRDAAIEALRAQVEAARSGTVARLGQAIDQSRDFAAAAALVRQLMFIDRFRAELRAGPVSAHGV